MAILVAFRQSLSSTAKRQPSVFRRKVALPAKSRVLRSIQQNSFNEPRRVVILCSLSSRCWVSSTQTTPQEIFGCAA